MQNCSNVNNYFFPSRINKIYFTAMKIYKAMAKRKSLLYYFFSIFNSRYVYISVYRDKVSIHCKHLYV